MPVIYRSSCFLSLSPASLGVRIRLFAHRAPAVHACISKGSAGLQCMWIGMMNLLQSAPGVWPQPSDDAARMRGSGSGGMFQPSLATSFQDLAYGKLYSSRGHPMHCVEVLAKRQWADGALAAVSPASRLARWNDLPCCRMLRRNAAAPC